MIHHFWFTWVWPSLKGNGPEDALATIGLAAVTALVWPPARRAVHRFFDNKNTELHRKLDHIIRHHPDIPDLPPRDPSGSHAG